MPDNALLDIKNISINFGGIAALRNVDLRMNYGEIHSLIGPNGAGKTTLLNVITCIYKPNSGEVFYEGEDILKLKPHMLVSRGISRVFQNPELFGGMTVVENLLVAQHGKIETAFWDLAFHTGNWKRMENLAQHKAYEMLESLSLLDFSEYLSSNLSFGQQKLLGLGRGLITKPKLFLLDEPAAGMSYSEIEALGRILRKIREEQQTAILLVEHHMKLVMEISDQVTVLNFGEKIAQGTPDEIRNNLMVKKAYLGERE